MDKLVLSHFLAKVIGIVFIVLSLGIFKNQRLFLSLVKKFLENSVLMFMTGFWDLLLGLLIVVSHNVWVKDWPVIITIFGWIIVIRGILRIIFPEYVLKAFRFIQEYFHWILRVVSVILFCLGVYLTFFGFFTKV